MLYSLSGIPLSQSIKIANRSLSELEHEFAVVVNYTETNAVIDLPPGIPIQFYEYLLLF